VQVCLWLAAGIESAVILARAYPSLTVSKIILESLLFEGSGSGIRITAASSLGIILAVLGASLRAWCYQTLGKHFTFVLTMKKDQTLVTTGPYSVIRHPSYTGLAMVVIAIALLHATDGSWMRESGMLRTPLGQLVFITFILFPVVGLVTLLARVKEEEAELRKQFKKEWEDWAIHVPYMLIPGII
jgi:protein-S-isoprenylcysteine O-methyltransferase Ste14